MTEDILERAKAVDPEMLAVLNWGALRDLISELIAEANEAEQLQNEVERLRAENRELKKTDVWANDVIKEHESLNARIKELEALNELNHKNMRSWLDTTTDKEFLDKLSSEIGFKDAYIKRLEAAFLDHLAARLYYEHYPGVSDAYSWHDYPEDACQMRPKEMFRQKAREALERIKVAGGEAGCIEGWKR